VCRHAEWVSDAGDALSSIGRRMLRPVSTLIGSLGSALMDGKAHAMPIRLHRNVPRRRVCGWNASPACHRAVVVGWIGRSAWFQWPTRSA
jgi:hypothetical protein